MRFTTKTGLKLDANELKVLKRARCVVEGIQQHSSEVGRQKLASDGAAIIGELVALFSLDVPPVKKPDKPKPDVNATKELPFEQAESGAA